MVLPSPNDHDESGLDDAEKTHSTGRTLFSIGANYGSNWYLITFFRNLTLPVPCISESCIEIKIKLNFYFQTSLWCLKRLGFMKALCENKNIV